MYDIFTFFGMTTSQWLTGFCLAAGLLGARIGLFLLYDTLNARTDFNPEFYPEHKLEL